MPGPVPKPWRLRTRPHRAATRADLYSPGPVQVPDLPARDDGQKWRPETLSWWRAVRESPMRDEYIENDWQSLFALAEVVDLFWQTGSQTMAAEIRAFAAQYGLSPHSRSMLRFQIGRGEQAVRGMG